MIDLMAQQLKSSVKNAVWNLPNIISFARLLVLLPLTVYLLLRTEFQWALLTMVLLGGTDWLDGFVARRLNQVTEFGKNMDPIADRISIVVIGCALVSVKLVPLYLVVIIASVDGLLLIMAAILFRVPPPVPVSWAGKGRTALILMALPLSILGAALSSPGVETAAVIVLAIGTVGHVVVGISYAVAMFNLARKGTDASLRHPRVAAEQSAAGFEGPQHQLDSVSIRPAGFCYSL